MPKHLEKYTIILIKIIGYIFKSYWYYAGFVHIYTFFFQTMQYFKPYSLLNISTYSIHTKKIVILTTTIHTYILKKKYEICEIISF